MVLPVEVGEASERGVAVQAPGSLVPPGGRRAGLTAHWFAPRVIGQEQRVHTGWLEAQPDELLYAPHTDASYRFPESETIYRFVSGLATRWRYRQGRRSRR
jgi:hypothetical protein